MRKVIYTFLTAFIMIASFESCVQNQLDSSKEYRLNSWMAILNDTQKVCRLSIPGTHDALTAEGFTDQKFIDDYTTQVATFDEQLNGGIRYFDVRLVMLDDSGKVKLQTSHRTATIKLSFDDVLAKAEKFLTANPSEFVIIKIQYDGGKMSPGQKRQWIDAVQHTLDDKQNAEYFVAFKPDLRVAEMRGKILLISRTDYGDHVCGALTNWIDEGTKTYLHADSLAERRLVLSPTRKAAEAYMGGENKLAAHFYVQDFYNSIGSRMEAKLQAVEAMFLSSQSLPDNSNVWVLSHVSGFSTPKMNAIGYAENASKTNPLLLSLLRDKHYNKGVGIIAMDYACIDTLNRSMGTLGMVKRVVMSRSLTRAIIDSNIGIKGLSVR